MEVYDSDALEPATRAQLRARNKVESQHVFPIFSQTLLSLSEAESIRKVSHENAPQESWIDGEI